jgi:hypothetical protein
MKGESNMRNVKWAVPLICILLIAGCTQMQGKSNIDNQIIYRSQFNTALQQLNFELGTMPPDTQKAWAQKAVPFVYACSLALDTMDMAIGTGSTPSPEDIQAFLKAKNQMIDVLAQIVLAKKGGK